MNRAVPGGQDARAGWSAVRRVTWVGLAVNLGLAVVKAAAGWFGRSQAIMADALHSVSDMGTDLAVLLGVRFWTAPADREHPYGHRRIENLVTLLIGALLGAAGIALIRHAIFSLLAPPTERPAPWALFGALLSLVVKEWLFRWTRSAGRRIRSPAVLANAWHHRSDALSSVPALVAVAVAATRPEWAFVDRVGAVVVAVIIIKVAWDIAGPALAVLADRGGSREETEAMQAMARSVPGVRDVHALRSRRVGGGLHVDLHVLVDARLSVREGHDVASRVKWKLIGAGPAVEDVVVHLEPYEGGGGHA